MLLLSTRRLLLVSLLSGTCMPHTAFADPNADMAKQIEMMQKQIQQLQSQLDEMKKQATNTHTAATVPSPPAIAQAAALQPAAGKPASSDTKITLGPGPKIQTADGQYSFAVGGFAQMDSAWFDDDRRDYGDGTTFRRARLNVSGVIAKDWAYKFENDFAGNNSVVTDAYLEYNGFDHFTIKAGQFKEPFGMEQLTSDLHVTFLERASITTFTPDRNIGLQVATHGENWTAAIGGFGSNIGTSSTDDESHGATARLTYAPIADRDDDIYLHLGVAGSYRIPDQATDSFSYSSKPQTGVTSLSAVSTGNITSSDDRTLLGLEGAFVYGPFALKGEYMMADIDRTNGVADATLDGYYAEASYFITGETVNYNPEEGKFERVKVQHPFSLKDGTWGAWQVAARYGSIDLTDGSVSGGEMKDISLGIKWFPHERLRVVANYARIDTDATAPVANDDPNVWMLRTQFDF